jgi:hypothetical protein
MISVEKDQFIQVLNRYSESSEQEAAEVLLLKEDFPYSQLLHALSARVAKDHGFSTQQQELQMAAVYAADRSVLKEVMTQDFIGQRTPTSIASAGSLTTKPAVSTNINITALAPSSAEEDVADEVMHDLERLHELKHNFEMLFDQPVQFTRPKKEKPVVVEEPVAAEAEYEEDHRDLSKSKKERIRELAKARLEKQQREHEQAEREKALASMSRRERIIELARERDEKAKAEAELAATKTVEEDVKPKSRRKKVEDPGDQLIEEIAVTKDEISPDSEKQKEQLELIDHFIRVQPSITQTKEKPLTPTVGDLSTIKTGEFGDNVVSETLVEILVKQGKKDKAVEVLKKLIWKYPQKKAYFAAQIEDLRK